MAGFSSSTYAILYSKLKSVATGVKSVTNDPTNPNNIIFTLNDNSKITITLSNPIIFVDKYSSLSTTGKDKYLYVCKEDDGDNKKGIYIWNVTDNKYESLTGNGKGINIVSDYSKLKTSLTDDEIDYCLNDYKDTSVTPNKIYDKGFYLYDKTTNKWNPISASGKIASNTTLGNVIIKKDGGIEVDANGNIWIGGYTKTETIDPITGDKTTVTTFNGVTDTKIETPTGDVSEKVDVGGLPFGSSSDVVTNPDGSTTETIVETVGGQTTTTVINKDSSGNETGSTTTTEVGGEVISTITNSTSTTTDASGNTIKVDSTETTTASGGSQISSTTTTTTSSGDVTKVDKVENKDPSGITKVETTTTDPTGNTSTDITYDAPSDTFIDRNESDSLMDDIFNDFGW